LTVPDRRVSVGAVRSALWLCVGALVAACGWLGGPRADVPELSGLVASRDHRGVFWAHGDSGNAPILYAIDERARTLAEIMVDGASSVDWEDITLDRRGNLYIGDMGNNGSDRRDLAIHVLREPDPRVAGQRVRPLRTIRFHYPDQAPDSDVLNFDAEALFAVNDELFIATKHLADARTSLYRVPLAPARGEVVLEKLAELSVKTLPGQSRGLVTAAAVSPDGAHVALLTYRDVLLFRVRGFRVLDGPVAVVRAPPLSALEALAWDEHGLLAGSERGRLRRVLMPPLAAQ
jgi:hypothetical protein